ncbi:uncharacterized protein LOC144114494 [Amblyomma americanum]|uniref:INO80 complex subunit E N-terminal domain-containing protein n=1 Tax=Amblyomma americanum TaxID=6943 RepID=A0AAQ4E373_AMBAM
MPISDEASVPVVSYRQKYRNLKRKLKFLLYENECFQEELRKAQRKLLKVTRDKSFLLDQILQYESIDSSSSDSDATVSSDSDSELRVEPPPPPFPAVKKKKPTVTPVESANVHHLPVASISIAAVPSAAPSCSIPIKTEIAPLPGSTVSTALGVLPTLAAKSTVLMPSSASLNPTVEKKKKVARTSKPPPATVSAPPHPVSKPLLVTGVNKRMVEVVDALSVSRLDGHMTSEEVERHLEARQALRDLLPEKAPLTVPAELFSNEPPADLLDSGPPLLVVAPSAMASADAEGEEDELITGMPD